MKIHLCCGDIYLKGYINIDIDGYLKITEEQINWFKDLNNGGGLTDPNVIIENLTDTYWKPEAFHYDSGNSMSYCNPNIAFSNGDFFKEDAKLKNETTLDKYFKYPFIKDPIERTKNKRPFIIDKQMNILKKWDFEDNSVDEIVMVSCIEHFDPKKDLPHIFSEINRVMKIDGTLIMDWPDLKAQMDEYYGKDDEFLMELIYCNHKHQYAIHHWGFTPNTFPRWLGDNWSYDFRTVVKHDYPMQGVVATKIK